MPSAVFSRPTRCRPNRRRYSSRRCFGVSGGSGHVADDGSGGAPAAHDAGGATCESERWRLEAVVDRIEAKMAELAEARRAAVKSLEDCRTGHCRFAQAWRG